MISMKRDMIAIDFEILYLMLFCEVNPMYMGNLSRLDDPFVGLVMY